MALPVPAYIRRANIQDVAVKYEWHDWHLQAMFDAPPDELRARLDALSLRANIAFANGVCEWIVYRFEGLSADPVPRDQIEAAWAGVVDSAYAVYWEPPTEDWTGPVRRPLFLAMVFMLEAKIDAYQYADPARSGHRATMIAERVLTDPEPFRDWREQALARLERFYPLDEDDALGDVIPRQALDPDFEFRPDMTEELIRLFLAGLDPGRNSRLLTPEEMLEAGFRGVPYRFDMEQDRIIRNDY
jgi:hypothetical protein